MLETKPPHAANKSPHNILAAAATEVMWSVALATTRTAVASAARSLELWSQMLRAPVGAPPWSIFMGPTREPSAADGASSSASAQEVSAEATPPEDAPAFASYRSSSGHAAAQVITPH